MIEPSDSLSKQLLHSIPRKVYMWLRHLGLDTTSGNFGLLEWHLPEQDGAWTLIINEHEDKIVTIEWDCNLLSATGVRGSAPEFKDISRYLPWFVNLELTIYDELERLADHVARQRGS